RIGHGVAPGARQPPVAPRNRARSRPEWSGFARQSPLPTAPDPPTGVPAMALARTRKIMFTAGLLSLAVACGVPSAHDGTAALGAAAPPARTTDYDVHDATH